MLQDRHLDYSGSILTHTDCGKRIERSKSMDGGSIYLNCHIHNGSWTNIIDSNNAQTMPCPLNNLHTLHLHGVELQRNLLLTFNQTDYS